MGRITVNGSIAQFSAKLSVPEHLWEVSGGRAKGRSVEDALQFLRGQLAVMGLLPREVKPVAGSIKLQGEELMSASEKRYRELRGSRMAMIFQEPMTALNPVKTIGDQIEEVLKVTRED